MGNKSSSLPENDETHLDNLHFYQNKIESHPNGNYIDKIHANWFGDYYLLEAHHSYIQWCFPLRETGLNWSSQALSKFEASQMRNDIVIRRRLITSLKMMLDFYGMYLDEGSRRIMRAKDEAHVANQYHLLNNSFHNYLRITRILKSLGILGCEDLKFEFLNHLVLDIFKTRKLHRAEDSCIRFWIPTLRRVEDVHKMDKLVEKFSHNGRVNRNFRDGWGDEDGDNWSTQFFVDELEGHHDNDTVFEVREEVLIADEDPYEDLRKKFQNSKSNYLSSLRESTSSMSRHHGNATGNGGRTREFVDLSTDEDDESYNSDEYNDDDIEEIDEEDGEDGQEEELGEYTDYDEMASSMHSMSLRADDESESHATLSPAAGTPNSARSKKSTPRVG